MQEYYFLFALAFLWTLFAVVQDFKKREVANWLNFSLIAFALAYRAFYSASTKNYTFFLLGVLGVLIFTFLAYALYYGKAFAGGDAKLLIGYGAIFPYESFINLLYLTITFLFFLFASGAIYSLLYSVFIALNNKNKFKKQFSLNFKKRKYLVLISIIFFVLSLILILTNFLFIALAVISILPILYIYTKSLDNCMVVLLPPSKLTEGDWLEKNVKLNSRKIIKKTVHGLSQEDIGLLKRYNKRVLIKQGIPFTPSFLIALIIMVFFFLPSRLPLSSLPFLS